MYCLVWQRFWPLKWRLAHLSPGSRWAPVLELYIEYCSARLDGIGGDSSQVPSSLTRKPLLPGEDRDGLRGRDLCGKVVEVLFDCHGDLEGFVLDDCCERPLWGSLCATTAASGGSGRAASAESRSSSCAPAAKTAPCA